MTKIIKRETKAQPTYTNMYMHLMDEAPKIEEKITEQKQIEEATKKQKKEEKDIKTIIDRIPEGVPNRGSLQKK